MHNDDPQRAVLGYVVFERDAQDPENPVEHIFEWPIFDRPLVPEVSFVPAKSMIGFAREEGEFLAACDSAERRWLGFVSYRQAAEGKSVVRYTRLPDIQALSEEDKNELLTLSRRAREDRSFFPDRSQAAAALSTHEPLPDGVVPDPDPSQP